MPLDSWAPEHVDALRAHVDANVISYKTIAKDINERFGTAHSRNACIGKAKRMGFVEGSPRPVKPPKERKLSRQGTGPMMQKINRKRQGDHHAVTKILAGGNGGLRVIQSAARDVTPRLRCVEVEPLLLTFADLPEDGCKYPYGEGEPSTFRFCGHPRFTFQRIGVDVKSSYCGQHFDLTSGHGTPSERAAAKGIAA